MSRLHPIPYGAGILLVPDWCCPVPDDRVVKLPKLLNVRVDTVLRLVCEQVNAVHLIQPDHVKITHTVWGPYESGVLPLGDPTNPNEEQPPLLSAADIPKAKPLIKRALVTGAYKNVPLSQIIAVDSATALHDATERRSIFYAESWALIHYLLSQVPDGGARLNKYAASISEGAVRALAARAGGAAGAMNVCEPVGTRFSNSAF